MHELLSDCIMRVCSANNFLSIVKTNGQLFSIWKSWRDSQDNFEEKSLTAKEVQNQQTDKMRNSELEYLKSMGVPFTKPEELDAFINSEINDEQKIKKAIYQSSLLSKFKFVSS